MPLKEAAVTWSRIPYKHSYK